jgi:hypothetical protein
MIYTSCGEVRCAFHDGPIPVGVQYTKQQTTSLIHRRLIVYNACEMCVPVVEKETEPIQLKEIENERVS